MSQPDLILLHPPSVYDFREMACFYGPISDLVPSAPIFEMYPIGYMTIMGYLEAYGYSVRIINVALRMLKSRRFNVEKLIESLNPLAFGIDLHWLPQAHGSLEVARIVKNYHPSTPTIFGGLSASYYHEELMKYPQVDYVIRGDSTEEPLRLLLEKIRLSQSPDDVPNLTWRDDSNGVKANDLSYSPTHLDHLPFDYGTIIKSVLKYRDLIGHLPYDGWLGDPVLVVLPVRGCAHNCLTCGGGAKSFRTICHRNSPAYRSPLFVTKDISKAAAHVKGSVAIAIVGDMRQAGEDYAREVLTRLRKQKLKTHILFEFFYPASKELLELIASAVPNFYIEISPESHDEEIRRAFGRHYSNDALERSIADALDLGSKRVDVFFMIGLPRQTVQSVKETIAYCESLLKKFAERSENRIHPYISAMSPFLDPGSIVFEDPEKHGYRLFYKTLEEHRQALLQPSWKYMLNYETEWMSRDELVECTYDAILELNRLKARYGLMAQKSAIKTEDRILRAKAIIQEVDTIVLGSKEPFQEEKMEALKGEFKKLRAITHSWRELQWPQGGKTWKIRIKVASVDIAKVKKVCLDIRNIVERAGVTMQEPRSLPAKKLQITKDKSPYYDRKVGAKTYQALIHQMFIDIDLNEKVLTEVMELYRPKGLDMDAVFIQ